MATKIPEISFDRAIVEVDGSLTIQSRTFFRTILDRSLIIGSGSPEGVVPALQGSSYMDEDASVGSIVYSKQKDADGSGVESNEWKLIG